MFDFHIFIQLLGETIQLPCPICAGDVGGKHGFANGSLEMGLLGAEKKD